MIFFFFQKKKKVMNDQSSTISASVGYLVLSSLGDPLIETWNFAPSHRGTRPDPNFIGRIVIPTLSSTKNSPFPTRSSTLSISLNNYKNEDGEKKNADDQQQDPTNAAEDEEDDYSQKDHSLHIYALEFSVSKSIFVSVVMRIISCPSSPQKKQDSGSLIQNDFLVTKSWSDLCSLSIWFSSILSIDWLLPLSENIESITQAEHKESAFTTEKVLMTSNNNNSRSQKQQQQNHEQEEEDIILDKVIRMFHSSKTRLMQQNLNPALLAAMNFEISNVGSPSSSMSPPQHQPSNNSNINHAALSPSSSIKINNNSNNNNFAASSPAASSSFSPSKSDKHGKSGSTAAASGKFKYDNSLSACHETFLKALRVCLIKTFIDEEKEKEKEEAKKKKEAGNGEEEKETEEKKRQRKISRTNGKAVTAEANIILDDLHQQLLSNVNERNNHNFIDANFFRHGGEKENSIGIVLMSTTTDKIVWLLHPKRLEKLSDGEREEEGENSNISESKWKNTICSRLLKVIQGKVSKNKEEQISNLDFKFFGDKIQVVLGELCIEQDQDLFFHSLSFSNEISWKCFVVMLEC